MGYLYTTFSLTFLLTRSQDTRHSLYETTYLRIDLDGHEE